MGGHAIVYIHDTLYYITPLQPPLILKPCEKSWQQNTKPKRKRTLGNNGCYRDTITPLFNTSAIKQEWLFWEGRLKNWNQVLEGEMVYMKCHNLTQGHVKIKVPKIRSQKMRMTDQIAVHLQWTECWWWIMGYEVGGVPEQPLLLGPVLQYQNKLLFTHMQVFNTNTVGTGY